MLIGALFFFLSIIIMMKLDKLNKDMDKINQRLAVELNKIFLEVIVANGFDKNALKIVETFSPSKLKYEKKIFLNLQKYDFYIKISDIHYEVDIELLLYNSKYLWNEIFNTIYNSILSSSLKKGYIVFRNFDKINNDLMDILYNYMQKELFSVINIKYIIITECISFIPDKILNIDFHPLGSFLASQQG